MSEVELLLVNSGNSCTMYTIQFLSDDQSEFEKFVTKFRQDAELNPDFQAIDTLQGYVIDLQKFERLLKQEIRSGNVEITEKEILTDKTFDL